MKTIFLLAWLGSVAAFSGTALVSASTDASAQQGKVPAPGPATLNLRPYAPGTPQLGIAGTPVRPGLGVLRQDEDWSWLPNVRPEERRELDFLKYIPLNVDGSVFATFAFDGIVGYELFDDESFGDRPGTTNTLHLRANPHLALTIGERVRLYGALKFGAVEGTPFTLPPAEDDGPDLHQAFAELSFGDVLGLDTNDAFVRVGRQQLHYGGGRLVSIRGGPNTLFDFDGMTVRARIGQTIGEALLVRPSEDDPGGFDNGTDESQTLWGLYTTTKLADLAPSQTSTWNRSSLDLYYFGLDREVSPYAFQAPPLDETRHTVGARYWTEGPPNRGFNFEFEGAYQFGRADGILTASGPIEADISAGFVAGTASYGFGDMAWTPTLGVVFGASSGDSDPTSDRLTTFRAPFPPGRYFGEANPLGPGNIAGIEPYLTVRPNERLALTAQYKAFWRLTDDDGIYVPPQFPLRGTAGDDEFVGQEFQFVADYALNDYASINVTAAYFDAGSYLADNPPGEDIGYVQAKLNFSF